PTVLWRWITLSLIHPTKFSQSILLSSFTGRGDEAMLRADVPVIHVLTLSVMPGLVPGIHVLTLSPQEGRGWPGHRRESPRPAMTERGCPDTQVPPTCACSRHCRRGGDRGPLACCLSYWLAC